LDNKAFDITDARCNHEIHVGVFIVESYTVVIYNCALVGSNKTIKMHGTGIKLILIIVYCVRFVLTGLRVCKQLDILL